MHDFLFFGWLLQAQAVFSWILSLSLKSKSIKKSQSVKGLIFGACMVNHAFTMPSARVTCLAHFLLMLVHAFARVAVLFIIFLDNFYILISKINFKK